MKHYFKFKQITILQLMFLLASVGIIMTLVFQHYADRKLYKRTVQACIEHTANVAACSTPERI